MQVKGQMSEWGQNHCAESLCSHEGNMQHVVSIRTGRKLKIWILCRILQRLAVINFPTRCWLQPLESRLLEVHKKQKRFPSELNYHVTLTANHLPYCCVCITWPPVCSHVELKARETLRTDCSCCSSCFQLWISRTVEHLLQGFSCTSGFSSPPCFKESFLYQFFLLLFFLNSLFSYSNKNRCSVTEGDTDHIFSVKQEAASRNQLKPVATHLLTSTWSFRVCMRD